MSNQNSTSSFSKFEIIKILIPGFYFIFLAILFTEIFNFYLFPFSEQQFILPLILLWGTVVGLTIYSLGGSKKRKAFQINQPSIYISNRCKKISPNSLITESEAEQVYYYILNNFVPSIMHEKIFTFGMLFYVLNSIRRITLWFAISSTLFFAFTNESIFDFFSYKGFFIALLWTVYSLNSQFNKADEKMQDNYSAQILWMQLNSATVDAVIKSYLKTKSSE